ncbi:MAG: XTP/dITP diphosphatase [Deltaproteobacteria bacterium]
MRKIVAATKNKGKILEIKQILKELDVEVVSMLEEGIDIDIIEDGQTFEENALIKARAVKKHTDGIVLADDSGLVVDILNGEPGVYSSRFAGESSNDQRNNAKLLAMMEGVEENKRTARFVCVIALILPDDTEFYVRGECEGLIEFSPKGNNGFGYDPLFLIPEYGQTMAELGTDIKNKISHRSKALEKFKVEIAKYL